MEAEKTARIALACVGLTMLAAQPACADETQTSFAGKTVTVVVAAEAGGAYGLHGRVLAQYLGRHLPGKPTAVAQYTPGASGVRAANELYNVSPKDGTTIAIFTTAVPVADTLNVTGVKYRSSSFNWLGSMSDTLGVMIFWHTAPAKTVEQARKVEDTVGSTGRAGNTYKIPMLMNRVLGTKFKIVLGYRGTGAMALAMERGELNGSNSTWSAIKAAHGAQLREGKLVPMVQIGLEKAPDLQHVPLLLDFAHTSAQREVIEFASMQYQLGFVLAAPPAVPHARVAALRQGIADALRDPKLLADAARLKMSINHVPGEKIEQLVRRIAATPKSVIDKVIAATR